MCTKRNVVSVALSEIDRSFVLARESVPSLGITLMGNYTRTWLCIVLSLKITSATDQSKHTIHCCRFIREETATTTPFGDIHQWLSDLWSGGSLARPRRLSNGSISVQGIGHHSQQTTREQRGRTWPRSGTTTTTSHWTGTTKCEDDEMICSVNRSLSGAGVLLRDRQFSSLKMIDRDNVQERSYFY